MFFLCIRVFVLYSCVTGASGCQAAPAPEFRFILGQSSRTINLSQTVKFKPCSVEKEKEAEDEEEDRDGEEDPAEGLQNQVRQHRRGLIESDLRVRVHYLLGQYLLK